MWRIQLWACSPDSLGGGGKQASKGGDYTEEERRVLAATTLVNAREYLPFIAADLRYNPATPPCTYGTSQ
jgi:hypothetical protein